MLKRPIRALTALSLATIALAPLAAHATPSGTNNQIVAVCTDSSGNEAICKYNADGTNRTLLVDTTGGANYNIDGISSDGTKVLVGVGTGAPDPELFMLKPQLGTFTDLGVGGTGALSPDGTKIVASVSNSSTGIESLTLMNSDGTGATVLETAGANETYRSIVFSPDGTKFAYDDYLYNSQTTTTTADVYTHTLTAGNGTKISGSMTNGAELLDWSPDGLSLLVTDGVNPDSGTGQKIASLVISSGTATDIITPSVNTIIESAVYSPDGTKLLYDVFNETSSIDAVTTSNVNGTGAAALNGLTTVNFAASNDLAWASADMGVTIQAANLVGNTGNSDPSLPDAGKTTANLPLALGIFGLIAAGSIETARRVRRHI